MKKYVVSLLALLSLLAFQTPQVLAHGFVRGGSSRAFVGAGRHHFDSQRVIIINPGHARIVHFSPFANRVIIVPRHRFFIREPFFCFHHGIGFFDESSFFDHLHRFDGLVFETMPQVVVPDDSQMVFFGN